ncbi:MAG: hypothetical protein WCF17_13600 [Terracidiphilus sp.]
MRYGFKGLAWLESRILVLCGVIVSSGIEHSRLHSDYHNPMQAFGAD